MDIREEAKKYAEGRIISALEQAIEEAYVKGYNAACEEMKNEKVKIVEVNGVSFIDLGLPSGTLWSNGFYSADNSNFISQMTFNEAQKYSLPSWEQCQELFSVCRVRTNRSTEATILSPDGKKIFLRRTVHENDGQGNTRWVIKFWLNQEQNQRMGKCAVNYGNLKDYGDGYILSFQQSTEFKGELLPLLLVKSKE